MGKHLPRNEEEATALDKYKKTVTGYISVEAWIEASFLEGYRAGRVAQVAQQKESRQQQEVCVCDFHKTLHAVSYVYREGCPIHDR